MKQIGFGASPVKVDKHKSAGDSIRKTSRLVPRSGYRSLLFFLFVSCLTAGIYTRTHSHARCLHVTCVCVGVCLCARTYDSVCMMHVWQCRNAVASAFEHVSTTPSNIAHGESSSCQYFDFRIVCMSRRAEDEVSLP